MWREEEVCLQVTRRVGVLQVLKQVRGSSQPEVSGAQQEDIGAQHS